MTERKKLIEVALPLEAINRESAREKSIRHGHPSTLHLWWARRPLAACRALIFASYVDDPSANPDEFPTEEAQQIERERLFRIIEELVKWDNVNNRDVLKAAQEEIRKSCGDDPPPVYDPFCGGGSIPLEAQRLGLTAFASDLNPVAVLITKALIEIPPTFAGQPPVHPDDGGSSKALGAWIGATGLAEDVRYYGKWMREEAERRIAHLYPKVKLPAEHGGREATVIAWIWARTVKSPNPAWDGPMPLVRSFALSTKKGKETWVKPIIDREHKCIRFEIRTGAGCPEGTVGRQGAVCLATGTPVPLSYIREEGKAGRIGVQLMAIVADGGRGRIFVAPTDDQERIAQSVESPSDVPNADLPKNPRDFKTPGYGLTSYSQLYTRRQQVALTTFADLVGEARKLAITDGASPTYADAIVTILGLAVSKLADANSSLVRWKASMDQAIATFARQAIPMVWDFAESNVFNGFAGDLGTTLQSMTRVLGQLPAKPAASVEQLDAVAVNKPAVYITDPPYYDNIGYADLSDYFYVWLRRALRDIHPDLFSTLLVPKEQELVATPYRFDGGRQAAEQHFELGLRRAFQAMGSLEVPGFPLTVIYAFKQSEEDGGSSGAIASTGWETMLEGLLGAGLSVVGTWPLRSELGNRILASGKNALASSIALTCRPRPPTAALATRKEFLAALKAELPDALRRLQEGSIAPVDLAQAAIGPGMAVFSRFSKVVEADGLAMSVRTALGLINQVLDETLAEQEADFDPDTRWAVAWFEQFGMNAGPFGVAETLSKAKNTAVNGLVMAGILESKAGKVRLLERDELPNMWDPSTDTRLTVWEVTQHLIRSLESGGEDAASALLRQVGGLGETARELAYRLYVVCERKKWAKDALAFNGLVLSWPEISRLAAAAPTRAGATQQELL